MCVGGGGLGYYDFDILIPFFVFVILCRCMIGVHVKHNEINIINPSLL